MIEKPQLERSKAIQRQTGRTFHFATRLLPKRIRHATYVLYAFFRIADDVVDDPNPPPKEEQRAELRRIREAALGERRIDDPVLLTFQGVREQYGIPALEVRKFIAAMERDISAERYETHDELKDYLRGSSVAVAYMMLAVMNPEEQEQAQPHAKALGEAFQLTNFLRDVREDIVEYDRIYLPESTLKQHGVTEDQIVRLEFTDEFADVMRVEVERTERLYHEGVDGIEHLPKGCQFAVLLAAVLYADHHRLIREYGYDVLSNHPSLSTRRRVELFVQTWWHLYRTSDPRTTFDSVSNLVSETNERRSAGDHDYDDNIDGEDHEGRGTRSGRRIVRSLRSLLSMGDSK